MLLYYIYIGFTGDVSNRNSKKSFLFSKILTENSTQIIVPLSYDDLLLNKLDIYDMRHFFNHNFQIILLEKFFKTVKKLIVNDTNTSTTNNRYPVNLNLNDHYKICDSLGTILANLYFNLFWLKLNSNNGGTINDSYKKFIKKNGYDIEKIVKMKTFHKLSIFPRQFEIDFLKSVGYNLNIINDKVSTIDLLCTLLCVTNEKVNPYFKQVNIIATTILEYLKSIPDEYFMSCFSNIVFSFDLRIFKHGTPLYMFDINKKMKVINLTQIFKNKTHIVLVYKNYNDHPQRLTKIFEKMGKRLDPNYKIQFKNTSHSEREDLDRHLRRTNLGSFPPTSNYPIVKTTNHLQKAISINIELINSEKEENLGEDIEIVLNEPNQEEEQKEENEDENFLEIQDDEEKTITNSNSKKSQNISEQNTTKIKSKRPSNPNRRFGYKKKDKSTKKKENLIQINNNKDNSLPSTNDISKDQEDWFNKPSLTLKDKNNSTLKKGKRTKNTNNTNYSSSERINSNLNDINSNQSNKNVSSSSKRILIHIDDSE